MWLMSQSTSESVLLMGECVSSCNLVKLWHSLFQSRKVAQSLYGGVGFLSV